MLEKILQQTNENSKKLDKLTQLNADQRSTLQDIGYGIPEIHKDASNAALNANKNKESIESITAHKSQITSLMRTLATVNTRNLNNTVVAFKNYVNLKHSQSINVVCQSNSIPNITIGEVRPLVSN